MKKFYVTLGGDVLNLNNLTTQERKAYLKVRQFLARDPEPGWVGEFPNFWTDQLVQLYGGERQTLGTVLYKICQDLEGRLGIKQGYILPPEEYDWLWEDLGIADKGKLLFFFYVSRGARGIGHLTEARTHSYVILLNLLQVLYFRGYPYRNRPEPHSDYLENDLEDLVQAGYLREGKEGFRIARPGANWIQRKISTIPGYIKLVEAVRMKIEEFAALSYQDLLCLVLQEHNGR